jgi:hypothetical protein
MAELTVHGVKSADEYLSAGGANTICCAALDMLRALTAAVNWLIRAGLKQSK